ncbi:MAG: hypothetical protein HDS93_02210 [Bacteroidales bacterium]|nr:hypothetical protein [Bacteroidales bacterium]
MKKLSFIMLLSVLSALFMTGCKSDTEPKLDRPTEFVLNTPPMANQTIILQSKDDSDEGTDLYLTVSQPNYGLGVVTHYEVQVSYDKDFKDAELDADGKEIAPANYRSLYTVDTQAKIQISSFDMAVAICSLQGLTEKEDEPLFDPTPRPVYVRVKAFIPHCAYSEIYSNVICLTIQPYFAVRVPGVIYVVGQINDWDINNGAIYLSEPENGIGSKIYTGIYEMAADQKTFRFYTALGDWDKNSIGYQVDDNATDIQLEDGVYEGNAVSGKGSWTITNWEGGKIKFTVDLSQESSYSVIFEKVEDED